MSKKAKVPPGVVEEDGLLDENRSMFSKIWNYVEESMEEVAPEGIDSHDMKTHKVLVPISMLYVSVFTVALIYFAVQGALDIASQHFLSTDLQSGSVCQTVGTFVTAKYEADITGTWSTSQTNFQQNTSFFHLEFTGGAIDEKTYKKEMLGFQSKLNALGKKAQQRDITFTLLALSTMGWESDAGGLVLSSSAQPMAIFGEMKPWSWAIINHDGRCKNDTGNATTTVTALISPLDSSIEFKIEGIKVDPDDPSKYTEPCPKQLPSLYNLLGYKSDKAGSTFSVKFDVRGLADVVGINLGLFTKGDFYEVDLGVDVTSFGMPQGSFYIDSYYPDFQPFFCLSDEVKGNSGPDICFLAAPGINSTSSITGDQLSYSLFYPAMTSYGDFDSPSTAKGQCKCPRDKASLSCNTPDHLISLFYDTGVDTTTGVANNDNTVKIGKYFQKFLIDDPDDGDITLNDNVYPFPFLGTLLFYNNKVYSAELDSAFNTLCPDKKCAAFVVELSKVSAFTSINPRHLNLYALSKERVKDSAGQDTLQPLLMCSDLISQPAVMDKLVAAPPVELTMPFFDCHNTLGSAFTTSIGVAQGYAALASNVIVALVTFCLVQYFNRVKAKTPEDKVASVRTRNMKKRKEFESTILSIAQNQHALAPLILELVAASKDPRVEDTYAKFCYNQRSPPKPTRVALMIHDPPAEFVQEHKETITTFRETGETSVVPTKSAFLEKEEEEEEDEEEEEEDDEENAREEYRRIVAKDPKHLQGSSDTWGCIVQNFVTDGALSLATPIVPVSDWASAGTGGAAAIPRRLEGVPKKSHL